MCHDGSVDPRGQRLIGNPDHGGEWMIEMYLQAVEVLFLHRFLLGDGNQPGSSGPS
jgi:hypothetical protein